MRELSNSTVMIRLLPRWFTSRGRTRALIFVVHPENAGWWKSGGNGSGEAPAQRLKSFLKSQLASTDACTRSFLSVQDRPLGVLTNQHPSIASPRRETDNDCYHQSSCRSFRRGLRHECHPAECQARSARPAIQWRLSRARRVH